MSLYNVQDAQAPFMLLQGTGALPWDSGVLLGYRLRSAAMQISASALQLYAEGALHFGPSWRSFECVPSTSALCASTQTGVALMGRDATNAVSTPLDVQALLPRSELLRAFGGSVCTSERTGRVAGEGEVYTVSMCDLVEGALRFVVVHAENRAYWIRDPTGVGETVLLSCIALYAATSLAQNLTSLVAPPKPVVADATKDHATPVGPDAKPAAAWLAWINLLVCVACVGILIGMCEAHREFFVSGHDTALYGVLVAFLVVDVALLFVKETGPRDGGRNFGHQVGLSTVMLLLCTLRLHNTFNTPFAGVLLGLFGARAACKLLQHIRGCFVRRPRVVNLVSVLVDLGVWCSLLAHGLAQSGGVHDDLAAAANVATALVLGLGMSVLIAERGARSG